MDGCAGPLLRYRRLIDAEGVAIFADVKKKHSSHAVTADLSLADTVQGAEFFGADAVVVTGSATGSAASVEDLREVRAAVSGSGGGGEGMAVVVGSGVNADNWRDYSQQADAFIVGSHFKQGGDWRSPLCPDRVKIFMRALSS